MIPPYLQVVPSPITVRSLFLFAPLKSVTQRFCRQIIIYKSQVLALEKSQNMLNKRSAVNNANANANGKTKYYCSRYQDSFHTLKIQFHLMCQSKVVGRAVQYQ